MRRNSKKKFATRRTQSSIKWSWVAFFLIFLITVVGASVLVFQYRHHPENFPKLNAYFEQVNGWLAEHKSHLHQKVIKVKQVATNDDGEKQIHFEFYTTLPNAQMRVAESVDVDTPTEAPAKTSRPKMAKSKSPSIINADELEREFSTQLQQNSYVVQLATFQNQAGAERYRTLLSQSGFEARVVKLGSADKPIYRVQIGPFNNKEQAKLAQRQLLKKGMSGIIRKIEMG